MSPATVRGALLLALAIGAPALRADMSSEPAPAPAVTFEAAYVGDLWRNVDGGLARGGAYLDNLDLMATLDGGRFPALAGLTLHAHVMYNNGHALADRTGEAQTISNIEGVDTWRLYEMWGEYRFGASTDTTLRAGLYDLNSEFDSIDSAGLFLNSSHGIGPEFAQSGQNGPSIFPVTSLAVRLRQASAGGYWQVAAFDAVPGQPQHPERTGLHLGGGEGALLVAEFARTGTRLTKLAAGGWFYTARFEAMGETDPAGDPVLAHGNHGFYAIGEMQLLQHGAIDLSGWLRAGIAAERFNAFGDYVGGGVTVRGLVPGRPDDQIGLAVASVGAGARWRSMLALAGEGTHARETAFELTWRLPVRDWLTLQPDVQYVLHPAASTAIPSALAVGLRFELGGSWSR